MERPGTAELAPICTHACSYWGQISAPCVSEVVESADAYLVAGPVFSDYASVGYTLGLSGRQQLRPAACMRAPGGPQNHGELAAVELIKHWHHPCLSCADEQSSVRSPVPLHLTSRRCSSLTVPAAESKMVRVDPYRVTIAGGKGGQVWAPGWSTPRLQPAGPLPAPPSWALAGAAGKAPGSSLKPCCLLACRCLAA